MALAKFLDKAALAASQVLQGFERQHFERILLSNTVLLAFDDSCIQSEGAATLDMSVRLLSRLYPNLQITCLTGYLDVENRLKQLARDINSGINLSTDTQPTVAIVVGTTPISSDFPLFYIGSNGWVAKLSSRLPVGSGRTNNSLGAGAAACFGAANVFRVVFGAQLPNSTLDEEINLSLLSYIQEPSYENESDIPSLNLGDTTLVGLGAIGNSVVWALSQLNTLTGTLHLVDDQRIELSNLQRYVLALQNDEGREKVDRAKAEFPPNGLEVVPHSMSWAEYLNRRSNWDLERVGVALDSAADRIAVQGALPHKIFNAWTQKDDLGASRHIDFLNSACLACLYLPTHPVKNKDQLVAEAIGLPEELMLVRHMLDTNMPMPADVLHKIATAKKVPVVELMDFINRPINVFYSEAVCGGMLLRMSSGSDEATAVDAPLAFQSALAGIMLAAELVADAGSLRSFVLPTTTRLNLLDPVGIYLSQPEIKHQSGNCVCQDADYREVFNRKWHGSRSLLNT